MHFNGKCRVSGQKVSLLIQLFVGILLKIQLKAIIFFQTAKRYVLNEISNTGYPENKYPGIYIF